MALRLKEVLRSTVNLTCSHCTRWLRVPEGVNPIVAYFRDGYRCPAPTCGEVIDVWRACADMLGGFGGYGALTLPIGTELSLAVAEIDRDTGGSIDLRELGIPEGAVIVHVSYTVVGERRPVHRRPGKKSPTFMTKRRKRRRRRESMMVTRRRRDVRQLTGTVFEVHGNAPRRQIVGDQLSLYGASFGFDGGPIKFNVSVAWVPPRADDAPWRFFSLALREFLAGRYQEMVVPANAAVEAALSAGLKAGKRDRYAEGAQKLTQFTALRVAAPYAAREAELNFPSALVDVLDEMNRKRNKIAHGDGAQAAVSVEEASRFLLAAAFGRTFGELLEQANALEA